MTSPAGNLPLLKAGPTLALRKERMDVPELGGSVIVRGLTGSEAFAIDALRRQAWRRVSAQAAVRRASAQADEDSGVPELMFAEWLSYGASVSHLLHLAVQSESGLSLWTVEEWELAGQHHPGVVERLQAVAERLSGFITEDVRKNSASSPS